MTCRYDFCFWEILRKFCENSATMIFPLRKCQFPRKFLRKFCENDLFPAKSCWRNGLCENSTKKMILPFGNLSTPAKNLRKFCENDLFPAKSSWRNGQIGPISPFLRKFCENSAKMIFPLRNLSIPAKILRKFCENDIFLANSCWRNLAISAKILRKCSSPLEIIPLPRK